MAEGVYYCEGCGKQVSLKHIDLPSKIPHAISEDVDAAGRVRLYCFECTADLWREAGEDFSVIYKLLAEALANPNPYKYRTPWKYSLG